MPIWLLPLLGAAAGAMMNRKNPLKGAMLGGLAGFTGGAALGVGAGAAAGGSAALGGAGMAGTGTGLLAGGSGLAGAGMAGTGAGLTAGGAGLTGAGMYGTGAGLTAAAPAATGYGLGATQAAAGTGLSGLFSNIDKYAKPAERALTAANMAQNLMPEEQPLQPQPLNNQPIDLTGLLQQDIARSQMNEQDSLRRRQQMQSYMQNIG